MSDDKTHVQFHDSILNPMLDLLIDNRALLRTIAEYEARILAHLENRDDNSTLTELNQTYHEHRRRTNEYVITNYGKFNLRDDLGSFGIDLPSGDPDRTS